MSQLSDKIGPARKARQVKKDRDTPSRPLSAYNFFFREQRAKILEEREEEAKATGKVPDKSDLFSILGKTIAQRWKSKADVDRQSYKEMAAEDMKRYRKEMDQYHDTVAKNFDIEKDEAAAVIRKSKKPKASKARKASVGDESTANTTKESNERGKGRGSVTDAPTMASLPSMIMQVPGASVQASSLPFRSFHHSGLEGGSIFSLPQSARADWGAYQNLIRQRELSTLQQQERMGLLSGLTSSSIGSGILPASLHRSALLSGGTLPGLLSPNSGMPSQSVLPSGLTLQEEIYLLNNRSQPSIDHTIQQRLDMMQRNQPSVDVSTTNLSLLQQRQFLLERQRLMEIQRLQQLLATRSPPSAGTNPSAGW